MQIKIGFLSLALASLAIATPARRAEPHSSCAAEKLVCCNAIKSPNDPAVFAILLSINRYIDDPKALVGLGCKPIKEVRW